MQMDGSFLVDLIRSMRKISISFAVFFVFLLLVAVGGSVILIMSSQIDVDASINLGVGIAQIVIVCLAAVMFISVIIVWAIVRKTGETMPTAEKSGPSSPPSKTSIASNPSVSSTSEEFINWDEGDNTLLTRDEK